MPAARAARATLPQRDKANRKSCWRSGDQPLRRARRRGTGVKSMWLAGSAASASKSLQAKGVLLIVQPMRAEGGCRKDFCRGRGTGNFVPLRRQGPRQAPSGAFEQSRIKVLPVRVHLLDFAKLPESLPFFYLQFAQARLLQIIMRLVPNQQLAAIFARKAGNDAVPMLPNSFHEIGRYADVERPVARACHDVDTACFHRSMMAGLALKLQPASGPLPSQGYGDLHIRRRRARLNP